MKKLLILVALLTSVLFISCSDTPSNPANENPANKSTDEVYVFPYDYLQIFEERKIIEWNGPAVDTDNKVLTVNLTVSAEDIEDLYIMAIAADPVADVEPSEHLFFVDRPGEQTITLKHEIDMPIVEVKAFVLDRVFEIDITPPYPHNQMFIQGYSTWQERGRDLLIVTNPFTPDVMEVFAHIDKAGPDELVYLQRPDEQKIILPGFNSGTVNNVHLFILSDPFRQ